MKVIKLSLVVAFILYYVNLSIAFNGGDGSINAPYQIATKADIESVNNDLAAHYILVNDIDLSGITYITAPIAPNTDTSNGVFNGTMFTGIFDGNGYAVNGLTIDGGSNDFLGLFGCIGNSAKVSDIEIKNISLLGDRSVGGVAGSNKGLIANSNITGDVNGVYYVGGLVGRNDYGGIVNSYSDVSVSGSTRDIGGLVGHNLGIITNSYSTGNVSGGVGVTGRFLGGLTGYNNGNIMFCYSVGAVAGDWYLGGLAGCNDGNVAHCYSTGSVQGGAYKGGLIGAGSNGTESGCFWDTQTSGMTYSSSGTGKTTDQLQTLSTFADAGWNFLGETVNGIGNTWQMPLAGGYPQLTAFSDYNPTVLTGDGSVAKPFQITSAVELAAINNYDISANYTLLNDIDMSAINCKTAIIYCFDGSFNGNGFAIKNMNIFGGGYSGLFSYLTTNASINVNIDNCNVTGSALVGALAAENHGNIMDSCCNGTVIGSENVGALVGRNWGNISYCSSEVSVDGTSENVGGLVGENRGNISDSFNSGSVTGSDNIGGLVGYNYEGRINDSSNSGNVSGNDFIGGMIGLSATAEGNIENSYSSGIITGNNNVGGLIGSTYRDTIAESYSIAEVYGDNNVGGLIGESKGWSMISKSYFAGRVLGQQNNVGGLVGINNYGRIYSSFNVGSVDGGTNVGSLSGYVSECEFSGSYSAGIINGISNTGGLIGYNKGWARVYDCFWNEEVSGVQTTSGAGTGLSTSQMKIQSTFPSYRWDFNNTWIMSDVDSDYSGYPILIWQTLDTTPLYTVTFNLGNGGTRIGGGELIQTVEERDPAIAPEVDSVYGWLFIGWDKSFDMITSDLTVNARYERMSFTVIFDLGEHGNIESGSLIQSVAFQTGATAPVIAADEGWYFAGWNGDFTNVVKDITIQAKYRERFNGKDGIEEPLEVLLADELLYISENSEYWNLDVVLEGDIDCSGIYLLPIGSLEIPFSGEFNGCGHTITNLELDFCDNPAQGLFGVVGTGGVIQNLGVEADIVAARYFNFDSGIIAGQNQGMISCCRSYGSVEGYITVGGIAGYNVGRINDCYSFADCSAYFAAGFVGENAGELRNCYTFEAIVSIDDGTLDGCLTLDPANPCLLETFGWDTVNNNEDGRMDCWFQYDQESPRLFWEAEPGDANYDGVINLDDIAVMIGWWLESNQNLPADIRLQNDYNYDGIVNLKDVIVLVNGINDYAAME
ncbi:MAG: GLUG motif-containing protein [Sedimentisphaeraceae bacterium JB056]